MVERWIREDARRAELLEALAQRRPEGEATWDVDSAWRRLTPQLAPERERSGRLAPITHWRRRSQLVGATAVAAAALFAVTRLAAHRFAGQDNAGAPIEVVAARGQQTIVTLNDGTVVRLNAGSRLRYASAYGAVARDVELDGEGYFSVVHDAARPFRVHAHSVIVEDLGTRFVVRAYPEAARVEVAVEEGRAMLWSATSRGDSAVVGAGQLARLSANGGKAVESGVDLERWFGWTHGVLVLDGLSVADAGIVLGRRYDVDVVIADVRLKERSVRARFRDEPLPKVMDALAFALGTRWSQHGHSIVLGE
ncbi:MAG: FecR domain-containing protein [bacterium]